MAQRPQIAYNSCCCLNGHSSKYLIGSSLLNWGGGDLMGLVVFDGISTPGGYLMPILFIYIYIYIYIRKLNIIKHHLMNQKGPTTS